MANPKSQEKLVYNYSTTWKRRTLLSTVALIVFILAATAAGLSMRALQRISWQDGNHFTVYLNEDLWYGDVYFLPPGVRYASVWSTFSAGVVCAAVSGLSVLFIVAATDEVDIGNTILKDYFQLTPDKVSSRRAHVCGIVWRSLGLFASLIGLVWSFVEFYTSSSIDISGILDNVATDEEPRFGSRPVDPTFTREGTYGVERWSCQIKPLWTDYWPWYPYSRSSSRLPCTDARASRWLMLPLLVMSVALLVVAVLFSWQSKAAVDADQQTEKAGGEARAEADAARVPTPLADA